MGKASESIYSGKLAIVPMAEVQHIEKLKRLPRQGEVGTQPNGLHVITGKTRWDNDTNSWANPIYIAQDEADHFVAAWSMYRSEIESETLADLRPDAECVA